MKNCLIFGIGRTGTTALTGSLAESGAHAGTCLHPPTLTMPFGFYEDIRLTSLNQRMMDESYNHQPVVPPTEDEVREIFCRCPYAFKDPRFAFTYPIWKPMLAEPFVCLITFRDPMSYVKSALRLKYDFDSIPGDEAQLLSAYGDTYRSVFKIDDGRFHYIHYSMILNGSVWPYLEELLGYPIKRSFVRPELCHNVELPCPDNLREEYEELKRRVIKV